MTGRKGLKAKVQKVIGAISNAWDWFQKLIAESKEGESLWDRLSNAVGSIWDFILNGVVGWLEQTIVKRALAWIAKKLDPTGVMAVITTIIDVFALVEAVMSKAKEIFEMIERQSPRVPRTNSPRKTTMMTTVLARCRAIACPRRPKVRRRARRRETSRIRTVESW